ncbi:MFS transporter [Sporocytophaga myxococcoides]|uniref:MFS transporter n=1 Tax=Sporocytophaga myxococcoides TaxID=153721 RepID=UPI00040BFD77|nr:MFS transporter [Sporocytophaga myxococcoides]
MSSPVALNDFSTKDESSTTLKEIALIFLLACIQFTFVIDYIVILPLGPEIMKSFQIRPDEYGLIISAYTLTAAIAGFFSSFFIDRFDRKQALLFCLFYFLTGSILSYIANTYYFFMLARMFTGAFGGVMSSLVMIYLGEKFSLKKLGVATSFVMIANGMATIVGVPTAVFFSDNFGWKFPFMVLLCINFIVITLTYFFLPKTQKSSTITRSNVSVKLRSVVLNANFIWPVIFMSLLTFAGGATILPFLSAFVSTNFYFSTEEIALMFFYGGLAALFVNPIVGYLIDKFGKQNVFLLLNFVSIIPLLLLTTFPFTEKNATLLVTTLFWCLSTARQMSGLTLVNSLFPSEHRGRFITINSSIQLLAGSAATAISGKIIYTEENLLCNFDVLGVIGICATIICIFAAFILEEQS